MDTREYLDLYRSESREHLRALSDGILRLEEEGRGGPALEACFRAAHTMKGMAAAMGFQAAAEAAHRLEDRLSALRGGERTVDAAVVDELLTLADALERAAHAADPDAAVEEAAPAVEEPFELSAAELLEGADVPLPAPGEALAVRILLEPTTPLKAARALLVRRQVEAVAAVVRTVPAEFGDDFAGDFRIVLDPGADRAAVERAIRSGGEVRAVHWLEGEREAGPAAEAAPAPLESRQVRVDRRHLDALAEGIGELAVLRARLVQLAQGQDALEEVADRLGRLSDDLQAAILDARMIPVDEVFQRFPRVVRDTARRAGKEVELVIEGASIRVDRAILEEIQDPLLHLLRNAVDHGIEAPPARVAAGKPARGRLLLRAERQRAGVVVRVEDDGSGIPRAKVLARARAEGLVPADQERLSDEELLRLLGRPGFSTADRVTELSGRGVGMDVVLDRVRALGGSIAVDTAEGRGTVFTLRLPLSLALAQALRVRVGAQHYLVPLTHVSEVVELNGNVERDEGRDVLRVREERLPLVRLDAAAARVSGSAVVYGAAGLRGALLVDELLGREQVVVKPYQGPRGALSCFAGVTLLGDGRPALVLDPTSVL